MAPDTKAVFYNPTYDELARPQVRTSSPHVYLSEPNLTFCTTGWASQSK